MKILWFPRLYADIDRLHLTTWREMGRCLQDLGHEVRIALAGPRSDLEPGFFRVRSSRIPVLRMLSFWISGRAAFRRRIREFDPDVVILDVYTFWFAGRTIRKNGRPVVLLDNRTPVYHATAAAPALFRAFFKPYLKRCYARAGRSFAGITAITEFYRDLLAGRYGLDPSTIGVWGSGFDPERFFPAERAGRRPPAGLEKKFVVLHHGEMSYNRGLLESIEAMRFVKSEDIALLLVGEGPARPELQALVEKHGLSNRVFLRPAAPHGEIPDLIRSADCGLLAYPEGEYWNANNPIKLLEYLGCGIPVVTTGLWTFRSVLGERGRVVIIETNEPERIAAGLDECRSRTAADPDWGRENAALARERHTWRRQAERLTDFIAEACGRAARGGGVE